MSSIICDACHTESISTGWDITDDEIICKDCQEQLEVEQEFKKQADEHQ